MDKQIYVFLRLLLVFFISLSLHAETEILDKAVNTRLKAQDDNVKSQKKVDALSDQTRDLVQEYRDVIRKTDSLQTYNKQLTKLVKQQTESLNAIQRQLDNAEETQRSIVPLMLKMIETLEKFVSLDLPFLQEERQQRVAALKEMMDRPDVSLPDKYRRIMEAYQIEMEYGRTIEAYGETIDINGKEYTVAMLRVGRLTMTYQTLDGKISGFWNKASAKWEVLPAEYNRSINKGLKIARKQAPPDLVDLPVQVLE